MNILQINAAPAASSRATPPVPANDSSPARRRENRPPRLVVRDLARHAAPAIDEAAGALFTPAEQRSPSRPRAWR